MGLGLQMTEKLNNNGEEGYKIQIVRCSFFKKTDVKTEREETLTHKVTQQRRHRGKTQKKQFWKVFWAKEGWRSVAKGKERYSALCKAMGECWHSVNTRTGAPGSKNSQKCQKIKKLQSNFDNYAEYDGVRSQSAHETNQKRSEPGLKQSRGKTRSMRRNQNKKFRFEAISPVESPVSVVGKSPCGQVDCL
jgi:hypothetical protein